MRPDLAVFSLSMALGGYAARIPPQTNLNVQKRTIFELPQLLSCLGSLTSDILTNIGDFSKLKSQTIECLCQAAISTDGTLNFILIGQLLQTIGLPTKQQDLEALLGVKCKVRLHALVLDTVSS